jgi:hypothetical protein
MHSHMRLIPILGLTVQALLFASAGDAATRPKPARSHEAAYRCKDTRGRTYVGQAIPAECMDQDVEVLDESGRLVRIIPGRDSLKEIAAQKAADEARAAAANRDKTLLATYLSVADIERLRDQRLELLVQQARVTDQYIVNLRDREARLVLDVKRFRPYSDKQNAPPLPDHIAEDIVNTVNGLQVYQQELAKNTEEQQRLRGEFDSDIARFKELKGIK